MPPPHSTRSWSTEIPSEETSTFRSRIARTNAVVTLTSPFCIPSSAARQSAILSPSGTSIGSCSRGVRYSSCTGSTGASARSCLPGAALANEVARPAASRTPVSSRRRSHAKPQAPSTSTLTAIPSQRITALFINPWVRTSGPSDVGGGFSHMLLTSSGRSATFFGEHTFAIHEGGAVLTGRQQEIWDFLVDYVDRHGYPPTVREIGDAVGLASPSTVHAHLANLERAGLLKRDPTKPRALDLSGRREPVKREESQRGLPLVGEIAAGGPLLAEDNVEDYLAVPPMLQRGGADFLLRVKGESMIEAGILDGDIVVVKKQQSAEDGDIVVALAGEDETAEEATVKRFFREDGRIRLQPENSALEPIYAAHVQILGRVTGVFRAL